MIVAGLLAVAGGAAAASANASGTRTSGTTTGSTTTDATTTTTTTTTGTGTTSTGTTGTASTGTTTTGTGTSTGTTTTSTGTSTTGTTTTSTTSTGTTTTSGGSTATLRVVTVSARGAAAGAATITVRFSAALPGTVPAKQLPKLSPSVAGSWRVVGGDQLRFTPSAVYTPATKVTLTVPVTLLSAAGTHLKQAYSYSYTVGSYTKLRVMQLLAQLHYLPLKLTFSSAATRKLSYGDLAQQRKLAYIPPRAKLSFVAGYPSYLRTLWSADRGVVLNGAIRAFEYQHGLTMDGTVGTQVWAALLRAAASNRANSKGYTYAIASKTNPETLTIWHNGKVVLRVEANTGIADAPTADGTYPVYLKLQSQVMKGTNPDGSSYADQVYWISYFNGGDAVHYFDRATYGWPQSLGCVELPWSAAQASYGYLSYGSLVSVVG